MTSALNPLHANPAPHTPAGPPTPGVAALGPRAAAAAPPAPAIDAVTLSNDAQASTQFLNAARNAPGIDQVAVVKTQAALQSATYHVPPAQLAAAIISAVRGRN